MTLPPLNLLETLNWCARYEIPFRIVVIDGVLHVRAEFDNISSEWPIREGTVDSVAKSLHAALYSVQSGVAFHRQHGFFPDPAQLKGADGTGDSENPEGHSGSESDNSSESQSPAPDLRTHFET